ncbi:hypothetical protein LEP1GSC029_2539 [Leptospira interrogans str. 2002000626]|uniref:Uncharacterized protein n=1 Tax=Leptospira interrogans str. 2002000626 TaxID=996803 RepID=A0A829CU87_LEPIR|nr:hypothetical protein LEP1GSC029_2539 [Leptospira interrogans str. 2002000626]
MESWILSYKDEHPEWKENFSYKEFLELVSLILMYEYTRVDYESNLSKLEAIFQFKTELHKKIIGIDSIALSRLFLNFLFRIYSNFEYMLLYDYSFNVSQIKKESIE